jgi:hypothetical protein
MQETGISNVMEQSHEESDFDRRGSQENMLSIKMKSTDMFDSKRVNDSKLSVPADFKKSNMGNFIPEEQHESDSDDKITTITGIVAPNKDGFLEDKPIKIAKKEQGPRVEGKIHEK